MDVEQSAESVSDEALCQTTRYFVAAPILVLEVLVLGSVFWTIPKFEAMFKEMDLGELPQSTSLLLMVANTIDHFFYLSVPLLLAGGWFAFKWGSAKRNRIGWFIRGVSVLDVLIFSWIASALYTPLIDIMNKIGK
jgi:hypothetical protein